MPDRNKILGEDLTRTIDEINAVVRRRVPPDWAEDVDRLFVLFGDFWALTLGRASEMAAKAVVALNDRVEALERAVGEPADHG
jgi:hypothetical protein